MQSEKSGAGEEDIYVPHLWYYELLQFLKDQEVPRRTQTNIEEVQSPDNESNTESIPEFTNVSLPQMTSTSETTSSSTPQSSRQTSTKTSRGVKNKCDEVLDVIGKRLSQPSTSTTDTFSDIGKVWASKLRDLDTKQAVHAEKIINDVFYEAQLGNLNRNCCRQIQQDNTSNNQPPFYTQHSLQTRPLFNNQPPFSTQQSFHNQPSFNIPPQFSTLQSLQSQHPYNTQPSFNTQPPSNPQESLNSQPSFDTQQPMHTQPPTNPQQSFNTEPPGCTQPSAADLFRNFSGYKDGAT